MSKYIDRCRYIVHEKMDGAMNMAIDEALCLKVKETQPVLRFYGFSPITLSIGRFQRSDGIFDFEALSRDRIAFVRRPTGGQAVLHDNELTYSFVLSKYQFPIFRKREVYRFIAGFLMRGLQYLGIRSEFNLEQIGAPLNPNCFGTAGKYEIITSSAKKIIGSAQYTTRTACLQQGSIPISKHSRDQHSHDLFSYIRVEKSLKDYPSTSLELETRREMTRVEVIESFRAAFEEAFPLESSMLSKEEEALACELFETKYSCDSWNRMK